MIRSSYIKDTDAHRPTMLTAITPWSILRCSATTNKNDEMIETFLLINKYQYVISEMPKRLNIKLFIGDN